MNVLNQTKFFLVVLMLLVNIIGCENKPHQIFNRDIAENEITDGNVVFIRPDSTEFSYVYINDHYSICMRHPGDTLTSIVLYSDVLEWYQGIDFREHVESYKERYMKDCIIKKESESSKFIHNAEMQTYKVNIVKSNVYMIGELSVTYNKNEHKRCVVESLYLPGDNTVSEIKKTLRYK